MTQNNKYPVTLDIDYSDKSDRLTAFFRLILVIPILIILGLVSGWESVDEERTRAVKWGIESG